MSGNTAVGVANVRFYLCAFIVALICAPTVHAVETGDIAPDFTFPTLSNPTAKAASVADLAGSRCPLTSLSDYRGKVIYLDFWDSSSVPCRDSLLFPATPGDQSARQDMEAVAVNLDVDPKDALRFLSRYPVSYPVVSDSEALSTTLYNLKSLPTA